MASSVYNCTLIELPKIHNKAGNITAINNGEGITPFEIKRAYYLYDIPGGSGRGAHAHKKVDEIIIAASGSFDIICDDGKTKRTFNLSMPYIGLYIPPGLWRVLNNFSSGSICMVLASEKYQEDDYVRDYEEFLKSKNT